MSLRRVHQIRLKVEPGGMPAALAIDGMEIKGVTFVDAVHESGSPISRVTIQLITDDYLVVLKDGKE